MSTRVSSPGPGGSAGSSWPTAGTAWYAVAVLFIAYVFAFADRYVLSLFMQPIKHDLQLSDTKVSLLLGAAFTIFYTVMGIPIGRLADRYSRRLIIALGIGTWSIMTALCGLSSSFWQLFVTRIGVGVGESALSPAAVSIISDLFPPHRLGRAMSVYSSGAIVGGGLAFIIGGLVIRSIAGVPEVVLPGVGQLRSWQLAFVVLGLPGLIVAALLYSIPEPLRRVASLRTSEEQMPPLREALTYIRAMLPVYLPHFLGFTLIAVVFNAVLAWIPTLLLRAHGMPTGQAGPVLGLLMLVFGSAGILSGGWWSDHWTASGRVDAPMRVGVFAAAGSLPFAIAAPLAPTAFWALALCAPLLFFAMSSFGAALAALQRVTPNRLRGLVAALYLLTGNLVSLGLGPTTVALCTDYLFRSESAVGKSIALVAGSCSLAATTILIVGLRPFRESQGVATLVTGPVEGIA